MRLFGCLCVGDKCAQFAKTKVQANLATQLSSQTQATDVDAVSEAFKAAYVSTNLQVVVANMFTF